MADLESKNTWVFNTEDEGPKDKPTACVIINQNPHLPAY